MFFASFAVNSFAAQDAEVLRRRTPHFPHPSAPEQNQGTRGCRNHDSLRQADRRAPPGPIPPSSGDLTVATIGTRTPTVPVVPDTADVPEITAPTLGWSPGNRTLAECCDCSSFSSGPNGIFARPMYVDAARSVSCAKSRKQRVNFGNRKARNRKAGKISQAPGPHCTRKSPLPLLPSGPGGVGESTSRETDA